MYNLYLNFMIIRHDSLLNQHIIFINLLNQIVFIFDLFLSIWLKLEKKIFSILFYSLKVLSILELTLITVQRIFAQWILSFEDYFFQFWKFILLMHFNWFLAFYVLRKCIVIVIIRFVEIKFCGLYFIHLLFL